jgi:molybdate transport system substrate-binding protein
MKRQNLCFALLLTFALVLTGCSNESSKVSKDASSNSTNSNDVSSNDTNSNDAGSNNTGSDAGSNDTSQDLPYQDKSLMVYSGAGLSKAMDEIGQAFEAQYGAKVNFTYGGCAQLLGQMEINKTGDVFVGGSLNDADIALEKGFTEEYVEIAYHIPAIAVPKGNPAQITSLADMAKPGVKLILGDEESNAIGKKGAKIFEKSNLKADIDANVAAREATVNEIITQLALKQGDAGLIWEDNGFEAEDIEVIEIPEDQNVIDKVPACVLSFTEQKELAQVFVTFVSSDEGKEIFKNHGFKTE